MDAVHDVEVWVPDPEVAEGYRCILVFETETPPLRVTADRITAHGETFTMTMAVDPPDEESARRSVYEDVVDRLSGSPRPRDVIGLLYRISHVGIPDGGVVVIDGHAREHTRDGGHELEKWSLDPETD